MPKLSPGTFRITATTAAASPQETGRRTRVCSNCSGCQRTPCQLCMNCRGIVDTGRPCIFQLCLHLTYSEFMKRKLARAAQRSFESLSMLDANLNNNPQNDDNHQSKAQWFLNQCKSILIQTHGISMNWQSWQQDSSWLVWHYQREQWGTASRVSSHPPRYNIQLLASSLKQTNNNSNYSSPPPPPPRSRRKNASKTNTHTDNTTVLTNVHPCEFALECHFEYLKQKKEPPQKASSKPRTPRIGQPFDHAWRRSTGDIVHVTGTWNGEYREDTQQYQIIVDHAALQGKIRLQDDQQPQDEEITTSDFTLPDCWVSMEVLHAGYVRALSLETAPALNNTSSNIPFFLQFKVPALQLSLTQQEEPLPRASFVWDSQFRIELKVLPSKQAENAGFGLFAFIHPLCNTNNPPSSIELPPGVLIDLGVYGPLRVQDHKSRCVSSIKNFIHNYSCCSWHFETSKDDHSVFDITDDATGQLHSLSRRSLLVYVNEVSGSMHDIPSLWPHFDPEGAVHFYLGHPDQQQGPLVLPVGALVELLVDYGPTYELERVRKNYSRVSGNYLQHIRECVREENYGSLQELQELSVEDMESDAIPFLQTLVKSWEALIRDNPQALNPQQLERALMVAMILLHEQRALPLPSEPSLLTLRAIITTLCSWFATDQQLMSRITSNIAYQESIRRVLGDYDWNSVPPLLFRRAIVRL